MGRILATMVTTTTYGTWLPGDLRGYVEDGRTLPHQPQLLNHDGGLLKKDAVFLSASEQTSIAAALVDGCDQYDYQLFCLSVESWHWLIDSRSDAVAAMVGRLKTAMRRALNRGRVWTAGYDKRYCFTDREVEARYAYIARHRGFRAIRPIPLG